MKSSSKLWVDVARSGTPLALFTLTLALASGCSQGTGTRSNQTPPITAVAEQPWTAPVQAPMGSPVGDYGQLRVEGVQLVNRDGDAVQLKGISSMWLNYESRRFAEDKQGMQWLRDNWNMRVFRAAMGIEPAGGYLSSPLSSEAQVRVIVRNAIDLGLYVIIDWHDHHAHVNVNKAEEFFSRMAEEFGQYPNVIYEPFNEPQCLEVTDRCGAEDRITWPDLKVYHERIISAIRAKDPDNLIILGTPTWSQEVDKAALDPVVGSNLMYTLHFYSCTHTQWLIDRAEQAMADGLPLFVTEWGATNADGGIDGEVCLDSAQAWHDWMNTRYVSWAAWKFDVCTDSSCLFKNGIVPTTGGWTDAMLGGHGPFVRDRMLDAAPPRSTTGVPSIPDAGHTPNDAAASMSDAAVGLQRDAAVRSDAASAPGDAAPAIVDGAVAQDGSADATP
jgi:aryl-phospho-beta-D-glucosidase BglC (GH1 family)